MLPIGTFAETAGTYVNIEGRWQSVSGAATSVGESRPGWKVLRVLGNLLDLPGFDYTGPDQITAELNKLIGGDIAFTPKAVSRTLQSKAAAATDRDVTPDINIYQVDALVRRSSALQNTREGREGQGA